MSKIKTKICTKCNNRKNLANFYNRKETKDGKGSWCKKCCANLSKKRSHKMGFEGRKNNNLKSKYRITLKQYDKMLDKQNGVCAICKKPEILKRNGKLQSLVVDHDHKTGRVRDLLCSICNFRLGYIENIEFIIKAKEYLLKHK